MKFTKTRTKHTQAGFTLVELVIVMAVIGIAIAGVLYYQNKVSTTQKANDAIQALSSMVGRIRADIGGPTGGVYSSIGNGTNASVLIKSGIVAQPFVDNGTTISDPWGNTLTVVGGRSYFGMSFQVPDAETCIKMASGLSRDALKLTVGTTAPTFTTNATSYDKFLAAGTVVKDINVNPPYNAANAATACGATPPLYIAAVFR